LEIVACELLKGYRMLDFTDDKGALCGKILADLGADVIKVEPPGGCSTRRIPPFLEDRPSADTSLYFLSYEANKRSITANLDSADARAAIVELAKKADFIVESFPVGYMDSLQLGYEDLSKTNPRLIYTSITPFGDTGPGKNYKAYDIVSWAAGGAMYLMGEEGKPPLQISLPQAGLHAGAEAAVASLIAHYPREIEGRGQRVVVNMQACVVWTLMNEQAMPILHGNYVERTGVFTGSLGIRRRLVFRCADGHVTALIIGGPGGAISTKALIEWMDEKGFAADWMKIKDWVTWNPGMFMQATEADVEQIAELEDTLGRFFMTMNKREIYAEGLKRRILIAPVANVAEIAAAEQLKARNFFVPAKHETLGRILTLPGPFAKFGETPIGPPLSAPEIGQHNRNVYQGLLGFSDERMAQLRATGAI
jgi:benzylsuccinate CoA-transferase BbsE subunit